ncbi:hypothetical protein BDQ17DRAFT_1409051, partial [Cyathus striatus]
MMEPSYRTLHETQAHEFIVAPRDICQSCHSLSGPKFFLSALRGPSDMHRNNVIPTGFEREVAESNISYSASEISRLDREIARLQHSLEALQQRRDALRQFELQERSLFAPIRKLSEDVLRQIFLESQLHSDYISVCSDPK